MGMGERCGVLSKVPASWDLLPAILSHYLSVLVQGASPGDVKEQLVASATEGVILDDPAGAASLNGSVPKELDISSTPNLLLYSMLNNQVPNFNVTNHVVAGPGFVTCTMASPCGLLCDGCPTPTQKL